MFSERFGVVSGQHQARHRFIQARHPAALAVFDADAALVVADAVVCRSSLPYPNARRSSFGRFAGACARELVAKGAVSLSATGAARSRSCRREYLGTSA